MPAIAEEMVKILMKLIKQEVKNEQNVDEKFINIVNSIFMVNKEYSEVLAMIYSGLASTEHLKEWETVYEPCYHWLSDVLVESNNSGEIRQTIDPDRTA